MLIDYASLLIALAFSSGAVLMATLASWAAVRKDNYLILGAIGVGCLAVAIFLLGLRDGRSGVEILLPPFVLLPAGLSFVYASTRAFLHKANLWPALLVGIACVLATTIPLLTGFLGLASIAFNAGMAVVLFLSALEYFNSKEEPRPAVMANAILYFLSALSFVAPVVVRITLGEWVNYPIIDPVWDILNVIMTLVGITGIGAITLTLHFSRTAHQHHVEAYTDPLTGVLNRRALFERFDAATAVPGLPVLLFDLDYFKSINDRFGHAQGDATLQTFAEILRAHCKADDVVARIGGEEFCMVLSGQNLKAARATAERVRLVYNEMAIPSGRQDTIATVSVGLATGGVDESFESILRRADAALYKAKRGGRNRVRTADRSLVA